MSNSHQQFIYNRIRKNVFYIYYNVLFSTFLLISFIILWQLYYVVLACIFHTTVCELAALLSDDLTLARIMNKWVYFFCSAKALKTIHDLMSWFAIDIFILNLVYLINFQACMYARIWWIVDLNYIYEKYAKHFFVINKLKTWGTRGGNRRIITANFIN